MDDTSAWECVLDFMRLPERPRVQEVVFSADLTVPRALAQVRPGAYYTALVMRAADDSARAQELAGMPLELGPEGGPESFDLIALHHAVGELIESAVAEAEGIGGFTPDPEQVRGQVVRALRAYHRSGELEDAARPRFLRALTGLSRTLSRAGRIVMSHHVLESDLMLGHPLDAYTDYLTMARRWVSEAGLPFQEVSADGLPRQWWLCLALAGATDNANPVS